MGAERDRVEAFGNMENGLREASDWYLLGPYVSERQWGTVREDYSADGEAWDYLPHDHARSRAYRWSEDGLAGFCDVAPEPVSGARPVERPRRHLEGAGVRPDRGPGQPRRGRQGVLVVPRRHPEPRLQPLALPLPPGGVPLRGPAGRERAAQPDRAGVRADRHGRLRRRPLLGRRSPLHQGRPPRPAGQSSDHERRARGRHPPRAADRLVPQHLELGRRRGQAGAAPGRRQHRGHRAPLPRLLGPHRGARARRHRPRAPVL